MQSTFLNHKEVTKVIYSTEHEKPIADRAEKYLKVEMDLWLVLN